MELRRKLIAQTGMSTIEYVEDTHTGEEWVEKRMLNPDQHSRFLQREESILKKLQGYAFVTQSHGNTTPGVLKMEYVRGKNLDMLMEQNKITREEKLRALLHGSYGLRALREKGIIHRDVKPGNIIVTKNNDSKICDFGLAKVRDGDSVDCGIIYGTPQYVSPEQSRGEKLSSTTDIFSFASTVFKVLTGRAMFYGDNALDMILNTARYNEQHRRRVYECLQGHGYGRDFCDAWAKAADPVPQKRDDDPLNRELAHLLNLTHMPGAAILRNRF